MNTNEIFDLVELNSRERNVLIKCTYDIKDT